MFRKTEPRVSGSESAENVVMPLAVVGEAVGEAIPEGEQPPVQKPTFMLVYSSLDYPCYNSLSVYSFATHNHDL